jgi:putative sigma-54 modulation protein
MQTIVKGRNVPVSDELREQVTRRLAKVAKQVSPLATLEVELRETRNPANPDNQVAEATLYLKGVTLRACEQSRDMGHAISLMSEALAVQVKRHRDKRRGRREARFMTTEAEARAAESPTGGMLAEDVLPFVAPGSTGPEPEQLGAQ